MAYPVKQVIIVNTGVPMSNGQLAAQVAHASIQYLLENGKWNNDEFSLSNLNQNELYWLKESYCKVVLKVNSKWKLFRLRDKIKKLNLKTALVKDYGHYTAFAVEPTTPEIIDQITGNLDLF